MARRLTRSLLVCLLIGLAASIGVAWAMSLAARPRQWAASTTAVSSGRLFGLYEVRRYAGMTMAVVELAPWTRGDLRDFKPADLRRALEQTHASMIAGEWPRDAQVPLWMRWPRLTGGPVGTWATAASGWPARCMVSHRRGPEAQGVYQGTLKLQSSAKWPVGALPLIPFWPGLLLDTAAYGLPLFIMWWAVPSIRRRRRIRRGGCPACGYDLRGNAPAGCPECGWERIPVPA